MRKKHTIPLFALLITVIFSNFPLNLTLTNYNLQDLQLFGNLININNIFNNPVDNPNSDEEIFLQTENDATGSWGNDPESFIGETSSNTTVTCDLTKSSYFEGYVPYSDVGDYYLWTNGFNASYTNMTFFSMYFEGDSFSVEADHSDGEMYTLPRSGSYPRYFMSFKLQEGYSAYLDELKIYLKRTKVGVTDIDINVSIYNSTWNSINSRNEPDQPLTSYLSGVYSSVVNQWLWVTCSSSGSSIFLDVENTANNTFYILPTKVGAVPTIAWNYNPDGYDDGNAYEENTAYNLLAIDFCIKDIKINKYLPKPSQIAMEVNGIEVTDGPLLNTYISASERIYAYSGNYTEYNILNGSSGYIYFDIETAVTRTLYFMVNVSSNLEYQTDAITFCYLISGDPTVQWNTTINDIYFPYDAYSKAINVLLPHHWNITNVFYQNNTEEVWLKYEEIPNWRVNWSPTMDGSWTIVSNTTNLGDNIKVFNSSGEFDYYFLNDTILINSTFKQDISEEANLTVFNRNNETVYNDQTDIIDQEANFDAWQILQNSSLNGTHWLRVVLFNGTIAGIILKNITCFNEPTLLNVTAGPDPPKAPQGAPISARIYYNDTYAPRGIQGAYIDSSWPYSSLNIIDWGNGYYNITFNTLFAPNGTYNIELNASKQGYKTATTFIKFNITIGLPPIPTQLKIAETVPTNIYVNDTKKFVILNYTYLNGTGIIGAQIQTFPDWSDPYFQAEDLYLTNASKRGLYRVWLDTTGTHSNELHTIEFFAAKQRHEPKWVTSDPFIILPIPTALDVSGYENLTYFKGETVEIAAYFKDNYHSGKPAITDAIVNWTINSTPSHSNDMSLNIVIFEGIINLPELQIAPGTYNVTIKAQAYDFVPIRRNITLNVLPKYETNITITNHSKTDIRVGKDVIIAAEIEFSNSSLNKTGLTLFFNIEFSNGFHLNDFRITNSTGMATITFDQIPEISWINVSVFYEGTPQIESHLSNLKLNISGKYEVNLTLFDSHLSSQLISGELVSINATLKYNVSNTWVPFSFENLEFLIYYVGYESEIVLLETDANGRATLEFTPPKEAEFVQINVSYFGNESFQYGEDYSQNLTITQYKPSLTLFDINPIEVLVGSPLILTCKLINSENGLPIANATVNFFIYLGDPSIRLISQSAVTDSEGVATTALLILQPFEIFPFLMVGAEYEGDASTASTASTSSIPSIPMTTTKYVTNYLNINWWWMVLIAGAVIGTSLAYRYAFVLPRRRQLIKLQKKIANKVKDAQNLKHAMIVHKLSGTAIYGQGFGVELDSDLISGFLTAISAFQTEIGVKGKKKEEETGGFELNYADFKILLTDGENSRFAFITEDRASETFRKAANETVQQFENEYAEHLVDWGGALAPFKTAHRLLERNFDTGLSQPLRVKVMDKKEIKHFSDLAQSLIRIGQKQQEKSDGKFSVENLMQIAVQARKEEEYEIYYEIYNLYKNHIFRPFSKSDKEIEAEAKAAAHEVKKEQKISEKSKLQKQKDSVKGIFIPNLTENELNAIKQAINEMSQTHQKLFTKELMFTPDEKRTKIVKEMLHIREKLKNQLNKNSIELEKFLKQDPLPSAEIYRIMENDKEIYEELGNEKKASELAVNIQEILHKFENSKEIADLNVKLSNAANIAKDANQNQELLKAAIFYRKAARIYVELDNIDDAQKYAEIAKYAEEKAEDK